MYSLEQLGRRLSGTEEIAIGTWGTKFGHKYPQISYTLSPFQIPIWCKPSVNVEKFCQEYKYLGV